MKKRILSWALIAVIAFTNAIGNFKLVKAGDENAFNYTFLSLSNEEDLIINANKAIFLAILQVIVQYYWGVLIIMEDYMRMLKTKSLY